MPIVVCRLPPSPIVGIVAVPTMRRVVGFFCPAFTVDGVSDVLVQFGQRRRAENDFVGHVEAVPVSSGGATTGSDRPRSGHRLSVDCDFTEVDAGPGAT